MGRNVEKDSKDIQSHFKIDKLKNISTCNICEKDGSVIPGFHTGNLTKHLKRRHPDVFENINEKRSKAAEVEKQSSKQLTLEYYNIVDPKKTIQLHISSSEMIELCIELVTVNGFPLRALECSVLKKLFDPITKALGITINRENIRDQIIKKAEIYKDFIKKDIKSKFVSLKIDSATRLDRSVLGVNIQYVKNNQITIRTLPVKELKERHTAEYICSIILEIMGKYNINLNKIYAFTSDNGRNMVKTAELLSLNQVCQFENGHEQERDEIEDNINDEQYFEPYNEEELESKILQLKQKLPILISVKCMAHTLQLAINDVITKESTYKTCIEKALSLVIKLRTPTILGILKSRKLKKPIRNIATRWNSTFSMVRRLIELRPFCEEMEIVIPELHLSSNDWKKMEDFCDVLKYPFEATIALQKQQLILSEAFALWYKCKLQLLEKQNNHNNNSYSRSLLNAMMAREKCLISNCSPILAAVFLDPRYKSLLNIEQTELAKKHIKDLCNYVNLNSTNLNLSRNVNCNTQNNSPASTNDSDDILYRFLAEKFDSESLNSGISDLDFIAVIDSVDKVLPTKGFNIFDYSEQKNAEVADIVKLVLGAPATRVSVERVFSILKWILTDRRNNLDPTILEDTLLLILNKII